MSTLLRCTGLLAFLGVLIGADGPTVAWLRPLLPTAATVLVAVERAADIGTGLGDGATATIVPLANNDGPPTRDALRLTVPRACANSYAVQVFSPKTTAAVRQGSVLLLACWLRAHDVTEGGNGAAILRLQMDRTPWTAPVETGPSLAQKWQPYFAYGVAGQDFPAGGLQLAIHLGQQRQTIDLAGLVVVDLGPEAQVPLAKLPRSRLTWPGMEPDAPWRAEAQRRIERYRMADCLITVRDAAGKPVPGATVRVQQQRRAFTVGSFVQFANPTRLVTPGSDGDHTRAIFTRLFDRATTPIYWADWGWPGRTDDFLAIAGWLKDHDLTVRGHVMIYPAFQFMPTAMAALQDRPDELRKRVLEQLRTIAAATKPFGFREYDVTNELRDCTDLHRLLGRDAVAEWYAEARRLLPGTKLALNENTILTQGGATQAQQDTYLDWYRFLKSKGQAPDVLGFQSHFGENLTGPERVWAIIDRFARETDAELQITEFDINTSDEAAQAAYTHDFMTACFAHPRIAAFTMWGFWEGDHWLPRGAAWRTDWTPKPNALVLEDLLRKRWWTDATATTDAQGRCTVKAFLGRQRVTAIIAGVAQTRDVDLLRAGDPTTVTFNR